MHMNANAPKEVDRVQSRGVNLYVRGHSYKIDGKFITENFRVWLAMAQTIQHVKDVVDSLFFEEMDLLNYGNSLSIQDMADYKASMVRSHFHLKVFAMLDGIDQGRVNRFNFLPKITTFIEAISNSEKHFFLKAIIADILFRAVELKSGMSLGWQDSKGFRTGSSRLVTEPVGIYWAPKSGRNAQMQNWDTARFYNDFAWPYGPIKMIQVGGQRVIFCGRFYPYYREK